MAPEQVAIGLPASTSAAGSGYTTPDIVHTALDYIVLGNSFGGQYQLSNPNGFADFRGLMTWSINWDVDNNLEFSNAHRPYLDDLMGVSVQDNNILVENEILISNYPNPFNPTTTISFSIEQNEQVELIIYNLKGQKIKVFTFPNGSLGTSKTSKHNVVWNGTDDNDQPVSSGIYFYQLKTESFSFVKKMILMK